MRRIRWAQVLKSATIIASLIAVAFSVAAFFVSRRANQIAAAGTFPHLTVESAKSLEFGLPASDKAQYYFCRTEVRIANTGGASTSIIGVDPIGDFSSRGFLPGLKRRAIYNVDVKGSTLWLLLADAVLLRGDPLLLVDPLVHAITSSVQATFLNGPFPYLLAFTNKGGAGLLPVNNQGNGTSSAKHPIRSIDDLRHALANVPSPPNSAAMRLLNLALPASGASGLPHLIPANSAEDVEIDFEAIFPPGVDIFTSDNASTLARYGLNLNIGYLLKFPDTHPLRIAAAQCGSKAFKDNAAAIRQLFEEQGWWRVTQKSGGTGSQ